MNLKRQIRTAANALGIDIVRLHNSPQKTLLGVAGEDFRTVIDVGANEGQFAKYISELFPKAALLCFEPLAQPYSKLTAWAATQNGRVQCFNLALGESEGEVEMHFHTEHSPSSSLLSATERCHELCPQTRAERMTRVRLSTLDQALGGHLDHLEEKVLLKLDVQGFEDRVLRGAKRLLTQCRAILLEVCLDPLYRGQASFHGLVNLLHEAGFRYAGNLDQTYGGDGRVVYLDAMFTRS